MEFRGRVLRFCVSLTVLEYMLFNLSTSIYHNWRKTGGRQVATDDT